MSFAEFLDFKFNAIKPENIGYRSSEFDILIKVFKTRESLTKTIRKQQAKASHWTNWIALQPLSDGEGY